MIERSACIFVGILALAATDQGAAESRPDGLAARVDRLFSEAYAPTGPGAAVRVAKAGVVVLSKGYGLADVEKKVPVTTGTPFRLASVTKVFTSSAVLLLAQRKLIGLEDPVVKYLPGLGPAAGDATVRHLLAHTSGVPDYLSRPNSMQWARQEYSVAQLVEDIGSRPQAFPAGGQSAYSNSNYVLLGAIVEKVSGRSFAEFVEEQLFEPLGLSRTTCGGAWTGTPGLATPYEPALDARGEPDWTRLIPARPYTRSAVYAAGGCVSSAEDLGKFHDALMAGSVIGKTWLGQSLAPALLTTGRPGSTSQGGWQTDVMGRRAAALGGALPGVCTWLITLPDDGISVILLSNRTPGEPRCGALAVQAATLALGG